MRSPRIPLLVICVLVFFVTPSAIAGDNEFHGVVHAIEGQYGVHHMHIPLLGFAMFFVRPEGISGMKLAMFENLQAHGADDISRVVEQSLGPGWHPFVRVRSRGDGETTLIYASPSGGKLRMMVVDIEPTEATVVEFKIGDRAVRNWLKEPGEEAESESGRSRNRAED